MKEIIGVRFRPNGKIYFFSPGDHDVECGQFVIVETARGVEFGKVVLGKRNIDDGKIVSTLKTIIRVATDEDKKRHEDNKEKSKKAFAICKEKIAKHKLDMKLIDAEYTFDNNKVLFYFTADGRIDFRQLVKDASVVAMSGSVPKGLDGSAYQRLVKIVKDAGKPVILDTSGKLLEEGIKAAPTLIKPNIDEIRMLTGKHCDDINDIIEAAKAIHAGGVEIVAVSLGADGSLAVGKEGIFRAVVPKIDAVNTVGCGDSMIAGFALGLSEGLSLEETLRRASAISAAAAMREETGFFVMEDMEALLPKIEIRRL